MIKFECNVYINCFTNSFKAIWNKSGGITKNKNWELEVYRDFSDLLGLSLNTFFSGCDHAGPSIKLTLLGFTFRAAIFDSRHWNYKTNYWEVYSGANE